MKSLIVSTFLTFAATLQGLQITEFDSSLYAQALEYNPKIADNFYCQKIPIDRFLKFLEIYENRPIQENFHGMRSHGNFFLWYLIQEINPALVIESGVWRGQSTWTIEQAAPNAKVIAIDPEPYHRVYISSRVNYTTRDFSRLPIDSQVEGPIVCFFDDHVNAYERIIQASKKGIKHLIFDDNYAPNYDDLYPHLTIRYCFEMDQFKSQADTLKSLIKNYYIMPQIGGRIAGNFYGGMEPAYQIPSIWNAFSPELPEQMKVFFDDATWYRWLTYVELY